MKGSDWMTSLERLLPLDVRHAFRFRFCSRIFVVNSWVMNYDSYDHWSHDSEGHVITDHVINVFSVIKKHNFDFSITTRTEDPTLKILELIRQSNFYNFDQGSKNLSSDHFVHRHTFETTFQFFTKFQFSGHEPDRCPPVADFGISGRKLHGYVFQKSI